MAVFSVRVREWFDLVKKWKDVVGLCNEEVGIHRDYIPELPGSLLAPMGSQSVFYARDISSHETSRVRFNKANEQQSHESSESRPFASPRRTRFSDHGTRGNAER